MNLNLIHKGNDYLIEWLLIEDKINAHKTISDLVDFTVGKYSKLKT